MQHTYIQFMQYTTPKYQSTLKTLRMLKYCNIKYSASVKFFKNTFISLVCKFAFFFNIRQNYIVLCIINNCFKIVWFVTNKYFICIPILYASDHIKISQVKGVTSEQSLSPALESIGSVLFQLCPLTRNHIWNILILEH